MYLLAQFCTVQRLQHSCILANFLGRASVANITGKLHICNVHVVPELRQLVDGALIAWPSKSPLSSNPTLLGNNHLKKEARHIRECK